MKLNKSGLQTSAVLGICPVYLKIVFFLFFYLFIYTVIDVFYRLIKKNMFVCIYNALRRWGQSRKNRKKNARYFSLFKINRYLNQKIIAKKYEKKVNKRKCTKNELQPKKNTHCYNAKLSAV